MAAKETEKMTIEQVADALGVSKTTVSRALSGKGRISEETRAKVYAYLGRTRTEPAAPQGGEKVRTNNIAMIVPQRFITLDLPFLRKCMGGICIMADQRGYDLMLCYASNTEYSQLQRQLANHKVDGVILTYAMADDPCIELLRQYETPFVLIGRSEDKTIPQADNDQVAAACEMTRILLQLGAKRIALLVGSTIYAVNTDRIRGYLRGFAEFGVPVDQRLVHSGVESAGQTLDALEAALEQKADCILCGDDEIAFEVMGELRTRHILVPNDLRVASLYDSSMLASITPSVSAVQYDAEQLGKTACRMLLDRLAGKEIVMRQLEGHQVILRDSTKWRERSHSILRHLLLALLAAIWLVPILWLLVTSFSTDRGINVRQFFPASYTLRNYVNILFHPDSVAQFPRWFTNTLVVACFNCVISTCFVLMVAYALSCCRFKGRKLIQNLSVSVNLFPGVLAMIAVYFVLKYLNLTNSYAGLIMVYAGSSGLGYLICKGFFDTIPISLREAAKLDGASDARVFFQVVLPMSKPILVYTIISSFMVPWTDFVMAKMILNSGVSADWTVAIGLYNMLQKTLINNYFALFCAGGVLVSIPISILFVIMQKFYVEGITSGADKG